MKSLPLQINLIGVVLVSATVFANVANGEDMPHDIPPRPFCDVSGFALRDQVCRKWGFCENFGHQASVPFGNYELNGEKVVIPAEYAWVGLFRDGLARASRVGKFTGGFSLSDAKWGFINTKDEAIIPFAYTEAEDFYNGYARVQTEGHWGLIDKTGKYAIEPKYDRLARPADERVAVQLNKKWGFYNLVGQEIGALKYDSVDQFYEGFARVRLGKRRGFVDLQGQEIAIEFTNVGVFSGGLAVARSADGQFGFVNGAGTFVLKPQWTAAGRFGDGLAPVGIGTKYGYIDKNGALTIPAIFDHAQPFHDGLAIVYVGNMCGFIRKSGEYAYPDRFKSAYPFNNGIAIVIKIGDSKYSNFQADGQFEKPPEATGQFLAPYPPETPDFMCEGVGDIFDPREWGYYDDVLGAEQR